MLETIREFGLACLGQQEELQAARQAHARYYLALAEQAEPHLFGSEQLRWLDCLERELDNLRAILQAGIAEGTEEREVALRLGAAVRIFWYGRGRLREGRTALERLLAGAGMIADAVRLKALNTLGILLWTQYDTHSLVPVADEALALARMREDQEQMTTALILCGIAMMGERRDSARAQAYLEEALDSARALGDRLGLYNALVGLGLLAWFQDDVPRGIAWFEECLIQCRAVGEQLLMSIALIPLASAELIQGHAARAHTLLEECLTISRAFGNRLGVAMALDILGYLLSNRVRSARRRRFWQIALGWPQRLESDAMLLIRVYNWRIWPCCEGSLGLLASGMKSASLPPWTSDSRTTLLLSTSLLG